jgi:hypothetical protein
LGRILPGFCRCFNQVHGRLSSVWSIRHPISLSIFSAYGLWIGTAVVVSGTMYRRQRGAMQGGAEMEVTPGEMQPGP